MLTGILLPYGSANWMGGICRANQGGAGRLRAQGRIAVCYALYSALSVNSQWQSGCQTDLLTGGPCRATREALGGFESKAESQDAMACSLPVLSRETLTFWLSDRLADWEDHAGPPGRRSAVLRARRKPRMRGSRRWPAGSRPWRRNLRSATRRCCCASCAASGASCSAGAGRATSPATPEGTGLACRALQGSAHARTNALPAHAARGIAAAAAKHA